MKTILSSFIFRWVDIFRDVGRYRCRRWRRRWSSRCCSRCCCWRWFTLHTIFPHTFNSFSLHQPFQGSNRVLSFPFQQSLDFINFAFTLALGTSRRLHDPTEAIGTDHKTFLIDKHVAVNTHTHGPNLATVMTPMYPRGDTKCHVFMLSKGSLTRNDTKWHGTCQFSFSIIQIQNMLSLPSWHEMTRHSEHSAWADTIFFTSRVKLDSTEKIFPPYPKHIVSIYGALMQFSVHFRMVSQSDTSHKYLAMCQQQTSLILSIYRMTGELLFEVTIPNHTVLIMNCRSVIFTCYKILPSNPESLESSPKSLKLTPCTRVATGATSATVSKCCFIKDPTCCFIFFWCKLFLVIGISSPCKFWWVWEYMGCRRYLFSVKRQSWM